MRLFILLLLALSGCSTPPGVLSAWNRFERRHPEAVVLSVTKCEAAGPNVGMPYADFVFRFRDKSGAEHEESWRYEHGHHAWNSKPVITQK